MKKILLGFIFCIAISAHAQTLCDSLTLSADTIYITQPHDTSISITLNCSAFNGGTFAYATCSFLFSDTTNINITRYWVLPGFNWGPWTHSFVYFEIIYNNLSIQPNTVVNALFRTDAITSLTCYLPVVFVINPATGIEENNHDEQFNVFPNPVTGELNIRVNSMNAFQFILYNSLGVKIIDETLTEKTSTINLSSYSNDIYFYQMCNDKHIMTSGKIIKQ